MCRYLSEDLIVSDSRVLLFSAFCESLYKILLPVEYLDILDSTKCLIDRLMHLSVVELRYLPVLFRPAMKDQQIQSRKYQKYHYNRDRYEPVDNKQIDAQKCRYHDLGKDRKDRQQHLEKPLRVKHYGPDHLCRILIQMVCIRFPQIAVYQSSGKP